MPTEPPVQSGFILERLHNISERKSLNIEQLRNLLDIGSSIKVVNVVHMGKWEGASQSKQRPFTRQPIRSTIPHVPPCDTPFGGACFLGMFVGPIGELYRLFCCHFVQQL